jgi:serralysin
MASGSILLTDTVLPGDPDVQTEVSYMSGVTAVGQVASTYYWQSFSSVDNFAHKWGAPAAGTPGGVIAYSFDPSDSWYPGEQSIIQAGLALWSAVANIQFVEVPYSASDPAQIIFHYYDYGPYSTGTAYAASGNDPSPGQSVLGTTTVAETTFDPPQIGIGYLDSFTAYGGYGIDTVIHEEGHLLGLGHAGPYNGTVIPSEQQLGPLDTRQWSLMSYINPADTTAEYYADDPVPGTDWGLSSDGYYRTPTTWMPLDILAAQRLYGAPTETPLSGGQVFGFNCNIPAPIGQFFDFTVNTSPVLTLWDAGTRNTLDVSGFTQAATIDLRPGGFSSVDGMVNNIAIAFETAIDTAIGGPGDTTFVLNADSDNVVGGTGANSVVATGSYLSYHDVMQGGVRVISNALAADTLSGIGAVAFAGSHDVIASQVGGTLALGFSDELFLAAVPSLTMLGGADTVVASGGTATVQAATAAGTAGSKVFGEVGGGLTYLGGASRDTVVAAHATVVGGSAGLCVYGNVPGSSINYEGGSAPVTVGGAVGSAQAAAGSGGGLLVGGTAGNNLLIANGGATVLFGEGNGDQLLLENAAPDTALLGPGAETISAVSDSGFVAMYGGTGSDQELGGSGTDIFVAGHGNATLTCGIGTGLLLFEAGQAGGSVTVDDWGHGNDWVEVQGYAPGAEAAMLAGAYDAGGSTVMTLPDGTRVTFSGVPHVSAAQFF